MGEFEHKGRRIVVACSPRRAAKDRQDQQKAVRRLLDKLGRKGAPQSLAARVAESLWADLDGSINRYV